MSLKLKRDGKEKDEANQLYWRSLNKLNLNDGSAIA